MGSHVPSSSGTPLGHAQGGGHVHHTDHRSLRHWWIRAFWWTVASTAAGAAIVFVLRFLFGMDPLWEPQVYVAIMSLVGGLGFLAGIGCFDWWVRWLRGKSVDYDDHSFHGATSWKDYFRVNTDHKVIGVQYLGVIFFFMVIAGSLAELVRTELARPGSDIVNGEGFNTLFTGHAALMIFLVLIPAFAGIANYVLPIMIGAKDMAFPKLNALSVWMLLPAGFMILLGVILGGYSSGWTAYVPLASQAGTGTTLFEIGVQFAGFSSIFTAVNFLVTIITMRAPGMTIWRMPLLVWANATTSALIVFGTPFVAASQFMTIFDRVMGTHFFVWSQGGDVVSYQHIFWFYSHPAVYIMLIPGFGIISEVVSTFARKPIFGYRAVAFSTVAIAVLGFGVWAHHMFVSGMSPWLRIPMMISTMFIAVPTGVKIFSWLGTLWRGRIHLDTAMLWALGFISVFVLGGLSGVFVAILPLDIFVTDTYYIVAHIHYVFFGGSVFTIFAGIYYWFPKITGKMMSETLGRWHFWLTFVGFNGTFLPMHWLGLMGMPRRVADYDPRFANVNLIISLFSILMVVGTVIFFYNAVQSWRVGEKAPWNPWRGRSLEWLVSSPPSLFNFEATPQVVGSPYSYGVEGARHAIVFAPEEIGGGELNETTRQTILVVARDTLTTQGLIESVRELGDTGLWRFTILSPVTSDVEAVAAERRQRVALSALEAQGIPADGRVVQGDALQSIAQAAKDADAQEILFATYDIGRSEWLRQDLVDRTRKATGLAVSHLTMAPGQATAGIVDRTLEHLMIVAGDGVDAGLLDAIRARVDREPARISLVLPANVPAPEWGDDATEARRIAIAAVHDAVQQLQASGVTAQGEVIDGDVADAAQAMAGTLRPDAVVIVGGPELTDQQRREVERRGLDVDVRQITLDELKAVSA